MGRGFIGAFFQSRKADIQILGSCNLGRSLIGAFF